ncbi:MAG: hypothetical protein NT027_07155 [Proteobacteria bacterium]|nr:hypothetical protein [Pseudomonadota bacterium]
MTTHIPADTRNGRIPWASDLMLKIPNVDMTEYTNPTRTPGIIAIPK